MTYILNNLIDIIGSVQLKLSYHVKSNLVGDISWYEKYSIFSSGNLFHQFWFAFSDNRNNLVHDYRMEPFGSYVKSKDNYKTKTIPGIRYGYGNSKYLLIIRTSVVILSQDRLPSNSCILTSYSPRAY